MKKPLKLTSRSNLLLKFDLKMKLSALFVLITFFTLQANEAYSQRTKITLDLTNVSVSRLLDEIESNSDFRFIYKIKDVGLERKVTIKVKKKRITEILNQVFAGTKTKYNIIKERIYLTELPNRVLRQNVAPISPQITQQSTISGTVTDGNGEPLPGASIVEKGTTNGAQTDFDGNFTLDIADENAILVISYLGFATQEVAVNGQTNLSISLKEDAASLDEVVVVGYGTQKKINLTGSIESVDSENLVKRTSTDISGALGGLVPGLTVIQNSGQPGFDSGAMNIRGVGTLRSSDNDVKTATQPLVLVDGIESSLTNIDANDIENVVILRDASSAAIYGVRAANGVILVTTKRGSEGKTRISYNMYMGMQNPTNLPDFLGSAEYADLANKAHTNDGLPAIFTQEEIDKYRNGQDPDNYPNSDWVGALFSESGFQQNHNLSITGGSKTMQYAISLNYLDREGLIKNTGYDRYTLRTNIDNQVTDKFKVGMNFSISQEEKLQPALGLNNSVNYAMREPPIVPIQYSNGDWGVYLNEHNSVAMVTDGGLRTTDLDKFLITLFGELEITKDLVFKGVASLQKFQTKDKNFGRYLELYNADHVLGTVKRSNLSNYHALNKELNLQAYLTYAKTIDDHQFKVLLGYEQRQQDYGFFTASIKDLPENNNLSELDAGDPETEANAGYSTEHRIRSGFSRLNYNYKGKYLFEANFRYDGTSRFPANNRFALFPSFSAGWRITEEPFFDVKELSNLKIRASWGKLGNQQIGNYPYQSVYSLGNIYTFGSTLGSGIKPSETLANKDITWETTTMMNFGADVGLFNGRINLGIDYYIKETSDILLDLPKPDILGANPPVINAGEIRNKGFELSLKYNSTRNKQFLYDVNANFSIVTNKITDLKGADTPGRSVGDPVYNIFGYEAEGLFQSETEINDHATQAQGALPGDIKFKDQITVDTNGDGIPDAADGVINGDDRVSLGSYFPGINFGFQFNSSYKSFDLSLTLQGAAKVKGYAALRHIQPFYNRGKAKQEHLDYWTPDNPDAAYPRLSILFANRNWDSTTPNSWWVQDASYVRIRNLQVGYTFDMSKNRLLKLEKMRVYVGGDNLLTITGFMKDLDPEIPIGGGLGYPLVRTLTAGMNIVF